MSTFPLFGTTKPKPAKPEEPDPFDYIDPAVPEEHTPGGYDDQPDRRAALPDVPTQRPPDEQPKPAAVLVDVPVKGTPELRRVSQLANDQWTHGQRALAGGDTAALIFGAHPRRRELAVKNIGDEPAFLGRDVNVDASTGWQLDAGELLVLTHTEAVFAFATTDTRLCWAAELMTEEK